MISKGLLLKKLLCLLLFISAVTSFKTILRTSVLQVGNKFHSQNYHTLRFDKSENHARNTVGGKNPSISYRIKNFIDGVFKPKEENQMSLMNLLWNGNSVKLRSYLVMAMAFMFFGKWFNLRVPFILQKAVDGISVNTVQATKSITVAFAMYGLARAFSVVCAEIKTCLFIHVSQNVLRKFGGQIFRHLHSLDSAFHLGTPSGVISVAYVRAIRGFQTMLFQLVFSVAPTILELVMVSHILMNRFGGIFAGITLTTFCAYLAFTVWITQWRIHLRQEMVEVDNKRNGFFIDSILNHEVVKLFTNENREFDKFDGYLGRMERLNIDSTIAVAVLNVGQAFMFSMGLVASLLVAFKRVQCGMMSVGDLVAVNSMLLQLAIPFNFMGYTYQELRQSFVDMGYIREVLAGRTPVVSELPQAKSLEDLSPRKGPSKLEFRNVSFRYNDTLDIAEDENKGTQAVLHPYVLHNVSISILPGQNVAIVGPSGSGKSTMLKLITRMLRPNHGDVMLDGVPLQNATVSSLRKRIAVVPQDTCLFDDSIEYNIKYGREDATEEEISDAITKSNLESTIAKFPLGLQTQVGERGARLSGGERQKVSIARAILRNPSLILCDEVTSSVDAFAEKEIVSTLRSAAAHRTTVTVAHRLTSIVHCDQIIVLEKGKVVERGRHADLITIDNGVYKKMWEAQNNVFVDTNHVLPMQELDWFSLEEPEEENSGSFSYSAKDTQDVHIKPTTSYSMKV